MLAAVVLGCLLMSLLVGIIMASWAEQKRLLGNVLVSFFFVGCFFCLLLSILRLCTFGCVHTLSPCKPSFALDPLNTPTPQPATHVTHHDTPHHTASPHHTPTPQPPPQDSNKQLEQTTNKLQEEKLRLDALLVRQYNLIAVLGKPQHRRNCRSDAGTGSPESSTGGDAPEGLTLGGWVLVFVCVWRLLVELCVVSL